MTHKICFRSYKKLHKKAEPPKCNHNAVTFGNPAILSEGSLEKPESEVESKTRGYL